MDFVKKYLGYAQLIAFAAIAAFAAVLWLQNTSAQKNLKTTRDALHTAQDSLTTALQVNADNLKTQQAALDQIAASHSIADANAAAAASRNKEIRSILNDLRNLPKADLHPVSPIVCSTVDRLYNDGTSACGG